jgi:hypothetical protein
VEDVVAMRDVVGVVVVSRVRRLLGVLGTDITGPRHLPTHFTLASASRVSGGMHHWKPFRVFSLKS